MTEEWRSVVGFEGLYEVSSTGKIKSLKRTTTSGGIMKTHVNKGYEYVHLCKFGKHKNGKVHRLVAEAFIPNPGNLPEVNHIDGCKLNNHVSNLEWVSASYNQQHARMMGLNPSGMNNSITSKPVDMLTVDGALVCTFPSFMEAERATRIKRANIQGCCASRYGCRTAGGYRWQYHQEERCMDAYKRDVTAI